MVHHHSLEEDLLKEYFQIHLLMLHLYLNHFHLQILLYYQDYQYLHHLHHLLILLMKKLNYFLLLHNHLHHLL
tara:strand:- start:59 stop:277 length:219 start_codon:yes stop_codon:yes gene_type:complete